MKEPLVYTLTRNAYGDMQQERTAGGLFSGKPPYFGMHGGLCRWHGAKCVAVFNPGMMATDLPLPGESRLLLNYAALLPLLSDAAREELRGIVEREVGK
jgi:hypothetical protein